MSTLTRNIMVVCSVVAICAALVGCSSSGDGRAADLQRQLDMAKTAQMRVDDPANAEELRERALLYEAGQSTE